MEIKVIPKVIQAEVYVTSDGVEYEDRREATLHEKKIKAEKLFGVAYEDIYGQDKNYVIVKSQDELDLLYDYISEVCDCNCIKSVDLDYVEFPAMVVYNDDAELSAVLEETYMDCKLVCEMYEKMLTLKHSKQ